jgi:hypothetical protein
MLGLQGLTLFFKVDDLFEQQFFVIFLGQELYFEFLVLFHEVLVVFVNLLSHR